MKTSAKLPSVRAPAMLLALLLTSGVVASACNPAIQPSTSAAIAFGDDASALATGDDSGWGDDGDDAGEPPWDAVASVGVDAIGPLSLGDATVAEASATMDAMPDAACTQALGAGDLLIDELDDRVGRGAGRRRRVARGREHGRLLRQPPRASTASARSARRSTPST